MKEFERCCCIVLHTFFPALLWRQTKLVFASIFSFLQICLYLSKKPLKVVHMNRGLRVLQTFTILKNVTPVAGSIFGLQFIRFCHKQIFGEIIQVLLHWYPAEITLYLWSRLIYPPLPQIRSFDRKSLSVFLEKKSATMPGFVSTLKLEIDFFCTPTFLSIS